MKGIQRFHDLIRFSNSAVITCHHNADPDALCAAYALKRLMRKVNRKADVVIVTPDGLADISRNLLARFKNQYLEEVEVGKFDLLIMVDASSQQMLGKFSSQFQSFQGKVVIVDHHNPDEKTSEKASLMLLDEEYTSTCEIVYEAYRSLGYKMSRNVASALLVGMVFDTRHFLIASASTLRRAAGLCESGAEVEEAYKVLSVQIPRSERIARLKAAQRCEVKEEGGWIIVTSQVNSHQAAAARTLIHVGADVALVAGGKKGELRVNLRATSDFSKTTLIHLGKDVAKPVGEMFKGSGGGHETAAGVNAMGDPEEALKACLTIISMLLTGGEGGITSRRMTYPFDQRRLSLKRGVEMEG